MWNKSEHKKICANPECGKEFLTSNDRQKYCCIICRNHMNHLSAVRVKSLKKQWRKCKYCGALTYGTYKEKFCNEEHKKAWEELVKLKRKCRSCKYYFSQEGMCGYALITGKVRWPDTYPCKVYEAKRRDKDDCERMAQSS